MSPRNIIRAWKDPEYRLSLSEAERALLPDHPAGLINLTDADLGLAAGGYDDIVDGEGEIDGPLRTVDGPCTSAQCSRCSTW